MKSCSHIFALITACVFLFCGCSNYLSLSKASSVPYPQTEYDTALKAYRDSLEMPLSPVDAEHGEDTPIVWEDTGMEAAVRLLLNRPEGTISRSDVWNLNTLTITERTMFEGDSGTTTIVTVTAQQGRCHAGTGDIGSRKRKSASCAGLSARSAVFRRPASLFLFYLADGQSGIH